MSFETGGLKAMSGLCIIFLTMAILLPIAFIVKLIRNFNRLRRKKFKKSFGQLYSELRISAGRKILLMPSFFLFRRIMLAVAVCLVGRILIWQIMMLVLQVLIQINLIGLKVYPSRAKETQEYFNEIVILLVLYSIFVFTPWVDNVDVAFYTGYFTILIVVSHLAVSLLLITL